MWIGGHAWISKASGKGNYKLKAGRRSGKRQKGWIIGGRGGGGSVAVSDDAPLLMPICHACMLSVSAFAFRRKRREGTRQGCCDDC